MSEGTQENIDNPGLRPERTEARVPKLEPEVKVDGAGLPKEAPNSIRDKKAGVQERRTLGEPPTDDQRGSRGISSELAQMSDGKNKDTNDKEAQPYTLEIDGKLYVAELTDPSDMEAWERVIKEQGGDHALAERVAKSKFRPSMRYRFPNVSRFLSDIRDKIVNPNNPKNEEVKPTKTLLFTSEDGKKFNLKLPNKYSLNDIRDALRAEGEDDIAEQVHTMSTS